MKLTRNDFLKLSGMGIGAAGLMMLTGCSSSSSSNSEDASEATTSEATSSETQSTDEFASIETSEIDTSEYVELTMYLIGAKTDDFDDVYDKINEILLEKVNCTVTVEFLSWGEHDTKYSLLFSSGEDFDLIFTASGWCHYEQTAALGGYYPLTEEFIQTYAPDIWEVVPEIAWNQAEIQGTVYMVPNTNTEFTQNVIAVRGDLMDKYGFDDITSWDEMIDFFYACAEDGMYASTESPFYTWATSQYLGGVSGTPSSSELIRYHSDDMDDMTVFNLLDTEEFADYCHQAKAMADAGCWSPDILSSSDERQTGLLTGRAACMFWNIGSCKTYAKQANEENPDWNVTICDPVSDVTKSPSKYTTNGMAINVNSNNKERAMMALNQFYTNPDVQDLAMLGIEGVHWEAVGDDQYKILDESGYGVSANCNWGWNNETIQRTEYVEDRTALDDKYDELMEEWKSTMATADHPLSSFSFDSTNVSTQYAAVEAVLSTYWDPLLSGLVSDVDASIEQLKSSLESAGLQELMDELQNQLDEYLADL